MNNLVISGSNGFIGSNLIKRITDFNVLRFDRKNLKSSIYKNSYAFIHLAGIAHDISGKYSEKDYIESNYNLTKKIFSIFLKSKSKVFIFISTIKVLGERKGVMYETCDPNPLTIYAKTKLKAENFLLEQQNDISKEKKIYILRPCIVHGGKQKGNLNLLIKYTNNGLTWIFENFENKRSFCSVDRLIQ